MIREAAINILLTLAFVAVMSLAFHLDGPSDHEAELATYNNLLDAQRQSNALMRRDMAAAQICREQHGEAGFTWSAAGQLVCIPRRGQHVTQSITLASAHP